MFTINELRETAALVYTQMPPTPLHCWPLLSQSVGAEIWIKHENHAPTGAFKVRGGISFVDWLRRERPDCRGVITATRGNHGQSQARAAKAAGVRAVVYIPQGNSPEKNAAMHAFGAELREHGSDFDAAKRAAMRAAEAEGLMPVPPFHRELVRGVATYGLEMFEAMPRLDAVYVPIGCGSGICGVIAARDALGLTCEVIGVVSDAAPAAKLSLESGHLIVSESAATFADGLAVREPIPEALELIAAGAARIVQVSDAQIAAAIRRLFATTHNVAEGAGAAALAALLAEADIQKGRRVGVVLSGGNIDTSRAIIALQGGTPLP